MCGSMGQIKWVLITHNICKKYALLQYWHVIPLIDHTGVWDTLMLTDGGVVICASGQGVSSDRIHHDVDK